MSNETKNNPESAVIFEEVIALPRYYKAMLNENLLIDILIDIGKKQGYPLGDYIRVELLTENHKQCELIEMQRYETYFKGRKK